jgi:hypothetical protein
MADMNLAMAIGLLSRGGPIGLHREIAPPEAGVGLWFQVFTAIFSGA